MMIAGHDFVNDVCATCGKKWLDIHDATMADVSKSGIAHQGLTNEKEIREIMTEAARRREKLDWAMGWNKPKPRQDSDSGQNLDSALRPVAPLEMEVKHGWTRRADGYWVRDVLADDGTTVRLLTKQLGARDAVQSVAKSELVPKFMSFLEGLLNNQEEGVRLAAAKLILDLGWGDEMQRRSQAAALDALVASGPGDGRV